MAILGAFYPLVMYGATNGFDAAQTEKQCRVVWRRGDTVGVEFLSKSSTWTIAPSKLKLLLVGLADAVREPDWQAAA